MIKLFIWKEKLISSIVMF